MMQHPNLVKTKVSQNEVAYIEWNPGMDLLATVFRNGALTCSRLLSLQKVWHNQADVRIDSIAWRPDGRVLAIGGYNSKTKRCTCTLHDVENGKEINVIEVDRVITSVSWFQLDDDKEKDDINRLKKLSKQAQDGSETFSHQLAHGQTQLNILLISTKDGKINFYALGLFNLGYIIVHQDLDCESITKHHMSSCLRYLTMLIQVRLRTVVDTTLVVFNLNTFHERSEEILKVSKMYAKITDELEYLDDTMNAITTSWADVLAGLDNKLSSYCSRKSRKPDESQSGYTLLSADELLQLLVIGFTSDNLEKFLADMSDKGLKKLNNAIEQTCLRIQNLIVKNAQKCCYHLHSDLNTLRGLALDRDRYREIGLEDKFFVDAMRSVGALMLKLTEFQQVIDHSLKSTKSFFRWLISIACRMTGDQSNSMVPNDINKTTQQDIQLITDFILDNFDYNQDEFDVSEVVAAGDEQDDSTMSRPTCSNFTLEQIGQYLKNESLSRLKHSFSKPGSNFWIEFFRQRHELTEQRTSEKDGSSVLLLYPHRANTSLVQEYMITAGCIRLAFESVAENLTEAYMDHDSLIHLHNFVRNSSECRVKVETDMKSLKHYTLFQIESEPFTKQYLLAQSLEDKTFQLVSIEFMADNRRLESIGADDNVLLKIADSNFYENKESRNILLSFLLLDTQMYDTIIAQVELNKLLEQRGNPTRAARDSLRIFRSLRPNESIERCSFPIKLKLDLYKEPPSERRHDLGIMAKKIKKTTGQNMFLSSGRGVIAFTSCSNKRLHLYELESLPDGSEIVDDEAEGDERMDESLIDTDLVA